MKPANLQSPKPSRWIAIIVILAMLAPTAGPAQLRHSAPEAVRSSVLKLGVGQWVRVREDTGLEFNGRITGIGPQVFQMERRDAAGPTFVYYADVVRIKRVQYVSDRGNFPPGAWAGLAIFGVIFLSWAICKANNCSKAAAQASW
jgi:hypothetical protein